MEWLKADTIGISKLWQQDSRNFWSRGFSILRLCKWNLMCSVHTVKKTIVILYEDTMKEYYVAQVIKGEPSERLLIQANILTSLYSDD